jgi:hypothetical protein
VDGFDQSQISRGDARIPAALVAKSSTPKSAAVGYTGLSLGPLSSNLYLAFR